MLASGVFTAYLSTAAATPAPAAAHVSQPMADSGSPDRDRCEWRKGHWEKKRVDNRWEYTWVKGRWDCLDTQTRP
ncbi:hypothetical protein ACFWYA_05740 [Streptomyces sp. NPDC059011]|uniref:hypothetical protein n=1 Tax=Streptomyces sp. NPDC059011 TaxID=3346696 RepID=UPI0036B57687